MFSYLRSATVENISAEKMVWVCQNFIKKENLYHLLVNTTDLWPLKNPEKCMATPITMHGIKWTNGYSVTYKKLRAAILFFNS